MTAPEVFPILRGEKPDRCGSCGVEVYHAVDAIRGLTDVLVVVSGVGGVAPTREQAGLGLAHTCITDLRAAKQTRELSPL